MSAPRPRPFATSQRKRSLALRCLRWIYLAVVLGAFAWLLSRHGDQLHALGEVRKTGLALALILSAGQFVVQSAFWWRALRRMGESVGLGDSLLAGLRAIPARYLPGSLWFAVGRGGLLWRRGASAPALVATGVLENLLSLLVVLSLGAVLYALQTGIVWLWLAPATLLLASPPVLGALGRRIPRLAVPGNTSWRLFGELVGWMILFWCWSATTFAVFLRAFPGLADELPTLRIAAAFLVAWGVGYLAVFAPQGIGIFELSLAALLGVAAGGAAAGGPLEASLPVAWVTMAAGYRGLILVRDLVLALAGILAGAFGSAD